MKSLSEILTGKTSEKIKESEWDYYYDLIIPNGEWRLIYIDENEQKAIQVYQYKDDADTVIMFEFSGDYERRISITKWYYKGGLEYEK